MAESVTSEYTVAESRIAFLEGAIRNFVETDAALTEAFDALDGSEAAAARANALAVQNDAAYALMQRIADGAA